MANTKKSTTRKSDKNQNSEQLICINKAFVRQWSQIICLELPIYILLFYILVQILFFKVFKCNESENIAYCQCIQFSMSEEVSFGGKVKLIILSLYEKDMEKYVSLKNSTKCRVQTIGLIKSVQDYGTKTKEGFEKAMDSMEDYREKAKKSIKNLFDND